jgi:hypothetical protein
MFVFDLTAAAADFNTGAVTAPILNTRCLILDSADHPVQYPVTSIEDRPKAAGNFSETNSFIYNHVFLTQ